MASRAMPIISLSPQRKNAGPRADTRRVYGDEPLPIKPSEHAPRGARIISRVAELGSVAYLLKIDGVFIPEIGVDEILNYVSPYELEHFENQQFEEEGKILKIAEAEAKAEAEAEAEAELAVARQRKGEPARRRGTAFFQESDDEATVLTETGEVTLGKHGRARPSYKHLYQVGTEHRRGRRDPETGDELFLGNGSSDDKPTLHTLPRLKATSASALPKPKRRRRKRDKLTGELIPLSPEPPLSNHKAAPNLGEPPKRRRGRPPINKGPKWDFDKVVDSDGPQQHSMIPEDIEDNIVVEGQGTRRTEFGQINPDHSAAESSTSEPIQASPLRVPMWNAVERLSPSQAQLPPTRPNTNIWGAATSALLSEPKRGMPAATDRLKTSKTVPASSASKAQRTLDLFMSPGQQAEQSTYPSNKPSRLVQDAQVTPKAGSYRVPELTKASQPNTGRDGMRKAGTNNMLPPVIDIESDSSEESNADSLDDGQYYVVGIVGHRLSDPLSHTASLGDKPVMLYRTVWENSDELTWEPEEHFDSKDMVNEYRRGVGLPPISE